MASVASWGLATAPRSRLSSASASSLKTTPARCRYPLVVFISEWPAFAMSAVGFAPAAASLVMLE
jgi:hypothetical protein